RSRQPRPPSAPSPGQGTPVISADSQAATSGQQAGASRSAEVKFAIIGAGFGLRRYLRFGCDVTGVRWEETDRLWHIATPHGAVRARFVIAGAGSLAEPSLPDIPGIERFAGRVMHSARWDATWPPARRRVAVIGTGASAIQIVPAIQPQVEHLTVFQRSTAYVVPHTSKPVEPWRSAVY